MRVLILSQFFAPEPIPKPLDLARALLARGHSVYVITGFPNYPSGRIYPGHRLRLCARETVAGVKVYRSFLFPSHSKSVAGRITNYCSFMLSAMVTAVFTPPCDVMYVWHPPLTIGVCAWVISLFKHVPYVYDVQDIWPESGVWSGMLKKGFLYRILQLLEKAVYFCADHILVVTEGARANLISKGVRPAKISIASHWIDEEMFAYQTSPEQADKAKAIRREYGFQDKFVIMYAGNMGLVQGLHIAIAAAEILEDQPALWVFVGEGTDLDRLRGLAADKKLSNVRFIPRQPMEDIPYFMAAADAVLLHLSCAEICEHAIPVKTYAYMAAGKPVLCAVKGAAAELVRKAQAGIIVSPDEPAALAEGVRHMMTLPPGERSAMGKRGQVYLKSNYSQERVLDEYIGMLRTIAQASSPAGTVGAN
ncbi:MAG: glycosyltransferase family 4 protein [Elusimicrobia bacterium]|nr:glycosyltransferase family 4 protein [Candidatus Obscuribacterium magneticum]